jgi:hypothetical protein
MFTRYLNDELSSAYRRWLMDRSNLPLAPELVVDAIILLRSNEPPLVTAFISKCTFILLEDFEHEDELPNLVAESPNRTVDTFSTYDCSHCCVKLRPCATLITMSNSNNLETQSLKEVPTAAYVHFTYLRLAK